MRREMVAMHGGLLVVVMAASVGATPYVGSSFLPGPINVHFDEEGVPDGTPVGDQYSSLGVSFGGPNSAAYQSSATYPGVGDLHIPHEDPNAVINFVPGGSGPPKNFNIMFSRPVHNAVFALGSQTGTVTLTSAYVGGNVETFSAPSGMALSDDIYGFTNSLFDEITVHVESGDFAGVLDNVQFDTVEPGLGDANLDGRIDADDFGLIDRGYGEHLWGWGNGDFNNDGVIDGDDYAIINAAFASQGPAPQPAGAVPEPAGVGLLGVGGIALGRRRGGGTGERVTRN